MSYKRRPMVKRRNLHSKRKPRVQISSSHLGVKRHFAEQNFIPRPFDGSTVKGKFYDTFGEWMVAAQAVIIHVDSCFCQEV